MGLRSSDRGADGIEEMPNEQLFGVLVADTIREDTQPEEVDEVITMLRDGKFMLHGVKEEQSVPRVLSSGIAPLTPEARGSCWNTGRSVFGSLEPYPFPHGSEKRLQTYGCAFFHYGHSYSPREDRIFMTIALSDANTLKEFGINMDSIYREDSEISIPILVPRYGIHILRVDLPRNLSLTPRENGQKAESAMFKLLASTLRNVYTPGGYSEIKE